MFGFESAFLLLLTVASTASAGNSDVRQGSLRQHPSDMWHPSNQPESAHSIPGSFRKPLSQDRRRLVVEVLPSDAECSSYGVASNAAPYTSQTLKNSKECADLCRKDAKCMYWVYSDITLLCYFHAVGFLEKQKSYPNSRAGPRTCNCVLYGVDFQLNNAQVLPSMTNEECQKICFADCRCNLAQNSAKYCSIKTQAAVPSFAANGFSSYKQCNCSIPNVGFKDGAEVFKLTNVFFITSYQLCRSWLRPDSRCAYWSWEPTTKTCYCIPPAGVAQVVYSKGRVSGSPLCNDLPIRYCSLKNVEIVGHTYFNLGVVGSPAYCMSRCQSQAACKAWTLDKDGKCVLKDKISEGMEFKNGSFSGSIDCPYRDL